jgi:hypothetical protein
VYVEGFVDQRADHDDGDGEKRDNMPSRHRPIIYHTICDVSLAPSENVAAASMDEHH